MRRDARASLMWLGWARFKTVLLTNTINSSYSRRNSPRSGWSSVFTTTPSRTHCQNCFWVVQNSFRSRQTTRAVFFFFFFFASFFDIPSIKRTSRQDHTAVSTPSVHPKSREQAGGLRTDRFARCHPVLRTDGSLLPAPENANGATHKRETSVREATSNFQSGD